MFFFKGKMKYINNISVLTEQVILGPKKNCIMQNERELATHFPVLAFSCVSGVGEDTEQDSTELLTCIHDNPPPYNQFWFCR